MDIDIREEIFYFMSKHERIVSNEMSKIDENIKAHFTKFGTRAGCKAMYDIIEILDDDNKRKVIEMMRLKKVM